MFPSKLITSKQSSTVSKKKLHASLSQTYFLPPVWSTGVNRVYLDKLEAGQVFRVETRVLDSFLADLRPSQLAKASFTCKFIIYTRLDRLLAELGKLHLGFDEGLIPDR